MRFITLITLLCAWIILTPSCKKDDDPDNTGLVHLDTTPLFISVKHGHGYNRLGEPGKGDTGLVLMVVADSVSHSDAVKKIGIYWSTVNTEPDSSDNQIWLEITDFELEKNYLVTVHGLHPKTTYYFTPVAYGEIACCKGNFTGNPAEIETW